MSEFKKKVEEAREALFAANDPERNGFMAGAAAALRLAAEEIHEERFKSRFQLVEHERARVENQLRSRAAELEGE